MQLQGVKSNTSQLIADKRADKYFWKSHFSPEVNCADPICSGHVEINIAIVQDREKSSRTLQENKQTTTTKQRNQSSWEWQEWREGEEIKGCLEADWSPLNRSGLRLTSMGACLCQNYLILLYAVPTIELNNSLFQISWFGSQHSFFPKRNCRDNSNSIRPSWQLQPVARLQYIGVEVTEVGARSNRLKSAMKCL